MFCQYQTLCHLQTARISALAQLRVQRTEWGLTQDQLAQPVFPMKNISPILGTALILALLGSVGSLTPVAISPTSTRSGDWGPPGWALPAQAVPFPLGQDAQRGLRAHGGWQVIPLRGKGPPPRECLYCLGTEWGFGGCLVWGSGVSEEEHPGDFGRAILLLPPA